MAVTLRVPPLDPSHLERIRRMVERARRASPAPLREEDVLGLFVHELSMTVFYWLEPDDKPIDSQRLAGWDRLALVLTLAAHLEIFRAVGWSTDLIVPGRVHAERAWRSFDSWMETSLMPALDVGTKRKWHRKLHAGRPLDSTDTQGSESEAAIFTQWYSTTRRSPLAGDGRAHVAALTRGFRQATGEGSKWTIPDADVVDVLAWFSECVDNSTDVFFKHRGGMALGFRQVRDRLSKELSTGRPERARARRPYEVSREERRDQEDHQLHPEVVQSLLDLRELRDRLEDHRLLQDVVNAAMANGAPEILERAATALPQLLDLLDRVGDPAKQAALVYEWSNGAWSRQKVAEHYGVTSRRIERHSVEARSLVAGLGRTG